MWILFTNIRDPFSGEKDWVLDSILYSSKKWFLTLFGKNPCLLSLEPYYHYLETNTIILEELGLLHSSEDSWVTAPKKSNGWWVQFSYFSTAGGILFWQPEIWKSVFFFFLTRSSNGAMRKKHVCRFWGCQFWDILDEHEPWKLARIVGIMDSMISNNS